MRKLLPFIIALSLVLPLKAIGFEFFGGAGVWSLNLLKGKIEDFARDRVDEVLKSKLEEEYPQLKGADYQHSETFSSGGGNFSGGFRIYPGGKNSGFSLGFSFIKLTMDVRLDGDITVTKDSDRAEISGGGKVVINSYGAMLSMRGLFFPSLPVTPYISLGLGAGTLQGEASYEGHGTVWYRGNQEDFSQKETKTIDQLRQEGKDIPSVLPIFQLGIGIDGMVGEGFSFFVEGGILDGFYLGGGILYRF